MALLSPSRYQPVCKWEERHGEEVGGLRWPGLALLPSTSPHCVHCREQDCVEFGDQGACTKFSLSHYQSSVAIDKNSADRIQEKS